MKRVEIQMSTTTKYHRAAIDGYVDMLCDASKRDTNLASADSAKLTPTLLAAQSGQLEALRILVGRGGEPEKTSSDGSTALHLAAAKNHLNCVSFLVNFGVNMWSLDNELHTAKDVAAIEQNKQVLDYLDQMMAKQSALNTKSVQKLKEKAKVAAEKRIKQLRKAQIKAIRQFEKDERYLAKLSNNRRLIKSAHSISDIKLVGRADHKLINYSASEVWLNANKIDDHQPAQLKGVKLQGALDSSTVPDTANYIGQKLKSNITDASNRQQTSAAIQAKVATTSGQLRKTTTTSAAATSTTRLYGSGNGNNSDESAYSSSVSSTSGYLSSYSKSAQHYRPKYSDLVALNQQETSRLKVSALSSSRLVHFSASEQQSLKSDSSIGTKLRGNGGVQRKVHLKRMLLTNSTNHQAAPRDKLVRNTSPACGATTSQSSIRANSCEETNRGQAKMFDSCDVGRTRLCTVQPKLLRSSGQSSVRQLMANSDAKSASIKWPPAPTMTRAISEPDFGASLQSERSADQVLREECEQSTSEDGCSSSSCDATSSRRSEYQDRPPTSTTTTTITTECGQISPGIASEITSTASPLSSLVGYQRDESQHELLTKCLSQLKKRHEAITRQQDTSSCNEKLLRPSKMMLVAESRPSRLINETHSFIGNHNNNSDELLQHQISAGEFPLRPSAIKQKQQQHLQHVIGQQDSNQRHQFNGNDKLSTTTISVDSIGSAGSLAQRNSRSSKSSSASSLSCSSSSYSPAMTMTMTTTTNTNPSKTTSGPSNRIMATDEVLITSNGCRIVSSNLLNGRQLTKQKAANCLDETIESFLISNGLIDLNEVFAEEKIDLEALMLLNEDDLKSLNILLGPRRKLIKAIEDRQLAMQARIHKIDFCSRNATSNNNNNSNSDVDEAMYLVVDTPL